MPHRIIFDTDPGVDDAMALLFAHRSPDIVIEGITTVLGNHTIDIVTRNALYLCERFGIDAPVHRGASAPLKVAAGDPPTFVHGEDGLGNIPPFTTTRSAATAPAERFIVDTVNTNPGAITIVAVGRLTNLARALMLDPGIAGKVSQVIIMGGALGSNEHTGNVTPVAEANIIGDPHAADQVAQAPWPLAWVGLDVTMNCIMDRPRQERLRDAGGDIGQFIWDISRFYEASYFGRHELPGFPVHDSCAIAYLLAPELFRTQQGPLRVVTSGVSEGQTIQVPDGRTFPYAGWAETPSQAGALAADAAAVLDLYEQTLTRQ
ncbi:MAG: nucleoside hydrolase [Pseudomonadota bacterium]